MSSFWPFAGLCGGPSRVDCRQSCQSKSDSHSEVEHPLFFVNDERLTARSKSSNIGASYCADLGDDQEAKPNVFSARPTASLAASDL